MRVTVIRLRTLKHAAAVASDKPPLGSRVCEGFSESGSDQSRFGSVPQPCCFLDRFFAPARDLSCSRVVRRARSGDPVHQQAAVALRHSLQAEERPHTLGGGRPDHATVGVVVEER
jgi:hypothetical protein